MQGKCNIHIDEIFWQTKVKKINVLKLVQLNQSCEMCGHYLFSRCQTSKYSLNVHYKVCL